jgi:phosphatidylserine/phosphatidylglycerophosphate/cardiolipin synthase-like enzyme
MLEGERLPARVRRWTALILAATMVVLAQVACDGGVLVDGPSVRERVDGDWARAYFTEPTGSDQVTNPEGGLGADLVWLIDRAETSVDIAAYDFELPNVAYALVAAHRRGVGVRLVTESDNFEGEALGLLLEAGIPVVGDPSDDGLMHNKFAVIDGQWVWTGSWNMTENGTRRNNNNVVLIASTALAENYGVEFEEMMAGQFGPTSPVNTPYPRVVITVESDDGQERQVEVETLFAPEGAVAKEVIAEIEAAQDRIRFMSFVFTSEEIAQAMVARAEAGVVVQGVMESRSAGSPYSQYDRLRRAVHDVLLDGNPYIMHHKVIIIDDETVILGSYNFSRSAETDNDENVLIIHDREVTGAFVDEFGRVYERAREGE